MKTVSFCDCIFVCVTLGLVLFISFFPCWMKGELGIGEGEIAPFPGVLHRSGHQLCLHLCRALLVVNLFLGKSLDWF